VKVLVTGGTGLISRPVALALRARGAAVTVFHRSRNSPDGFAEIAGDRADPRAFARAVRDGGPWDAIVDMIGGTAEDARGLADGGRGVASHVVACSTTSVYARPFARVPVTEDAACAPTFPYGRNKLAYEEGLRQAAGCGDFALTVVRPGHTYREASPVVHSLGRRTSHLDRIARSRPIVVHGDGKGLWSLAWADDVAEAIAAAAGNARAFGGTYHLAGSEWISWDRYHDLLAAALGAPPPKVLHVPAEELGRRLPSRTEQCLRTLRHPGAYDCSAAERDLGYRPKVTVAEGLARNVACLRERGLIEGWQEDAEYEQLVTELMKAGFTISGEVSR
jgi:nucleoside-diphosphate-sugar epimerase